MNTLTDDCFISIIDTICPLKWATSINNVNKYETNNTRNMYSPRRVYVQDFVDTTKLSYTQMWDVLTTLEKLHSTSSNNNKLLIQTHFNMKHVAEFAAELVKLIKRRDGDIPYQMTSIMSSDNEYTNKTYNNVIYNKDKNKNRKILDRQIFVPFTYSNQTCIVCDTTLPFDWPSKAQHNHGTCSSQCYDKCVTKYPTMTRKCDYNRCKTEMSLLHLEPNHYIDSKTNECCINFRGDFCCEGCAIDDYEENHTFNRLDAYLDRW